MNCRPAGLSSDDDSDFEGFRDLDFPKQTPYRDIQDELEEKNKNKSYLEELKIAISENNLNNVVKLLGTDIDINEEIHSLQWTPLLYAASLGRLEIIEQLLNRGALPNMRKGNYTPLMAVCECTVESPLTIYKCVKQLLEYGAKVDTADRHGITSLMYSCLHGYLDVVKLLIPFSYLEAEDSEGWTALFYAVSRNHIEIVEYLLSEGANICKCDLRGSTARQLAIDKGFMGTAELVTDAKEKEALIIEELENYNMFPQWEHMFPDVNNTKGIPAFFEDVKSFMVGINLERRIPLLQDHNISFEKLLSITDGELESIGFHLPYERRIILHNIQQFHNHRWSVRSLRLPPKLEDFTVFDSLVTVGTASKHLKIISSSYSYIIKRLEANINVEKIIKNENDKQMLMSELKNAQKNLQAIKNIVINLRNLTKEVEENTVPPADYIGPNNPKAQKYNFVKRLAYFATFGTVLYMTICHRRILINKLSKSVNLLPIKF